MAIADLKVHRVGLVAIRRPSLVWAVIFFNLSLALVGISRLTIDTSLVRLFHGGSQEFSKYQRLLDALPSPEYDVLVFVRSDDIFDGAKLNALRDLHLDVRLVAAVRSVTSIFSAREAATGEKEPALLLSDPLPSSGQLAAIEKRLLHNPLVQDRFLSRKSQTGQATLLVVSLEPSSELVKLRNEALIEISELTSEHLSSRGFEWRIGGSPIARNELLHGIQRDMVTLNSLGFLLGLLVCLVVFRSFRFVLIASVCPALSAFLAVGVVGLFGVKVSPLMNAIPLLVMAVTFTDAMHLLLAIRSRRAETGDLHRAVELAVCEIGPACVLASVTTAAALLTLALSDSPPVVSFGIWAAVAIVLAVFNLLVVLPLLATSLLGNQPSGQIASRNRIIQSTTEACRWLADVVARHCGLIVSISLVLTVVLAAQYAGLQPRYRLSDQLPGSGNFVQTNKAMDKFLGGSGEMSVLVQWGIGQDTSGTEIPTVVRAVHKVLKKQALLNGTLSVFELIGGSPAERRISDAELLALMEKTRPRLYERLYNPASRSAVVTALHGDLSSREIVRLGNEVEAALADVRTTFPEFRLTVTGISILLAKEAPKILQQLNYALIGAFVIVIGIIGLAFRSIEIALYSIIPNVLPVLAAGVFSNILVGGLDYASVIGLTIAFSLAVDDSTHFFNRLTSGGERTQLNLSAVRQAMTTVGPVLIFTTVILVCSLAVTIFGLMPTTRVLGQVCLVTLIAALVADLIILPALIMTFSRWRSRKDQPNIGLAS